MKKYKRRNFENHKASSTKVANYQDIEKLVFKVFLKHIKANNLYIPFRWSVNRHQAYRDIIHVISSTLCREEYDKSGDRMARIAGTTFNTAQSVDDILRFMHAEMGKNKLDDNLKCQMLIMKMVNLLLHNCVEHSSRHGIHIIEKIGSDIFNEIGKTLFGDDFKDMTDEAIAPNQREFISNMKAIFNGMPFQTNTEAMKEYLKIRLNLERGKDFGSIQPYIPSSDISETNCESLYDFYDEDVEYPF